MCMIRPVLKQPDDYVARDMTKQDQRAGKRNYRASIIS